MFDDIQLEPTKIDLDKGAKVFIYGATLMCVVMIFVAGTSIAYAMLTGMLGTASIMYLMFQTRTAGKTGARIWNWCMNHPVLVDLTMAIAFGFMFGLTPTGLLAAGAAGCMNSAVLNFIHDYAPNHGLVDMEQFKTAPPPQQPTEVVVAEFSQLKTA